jgi:flagellar biogenesis protein FliO
VIPLLILVSAISATPPFVDSQAVVAPAGGSDSASTRAVAVDSISASRLRAAQQAAEKGGSSGAVDAPASLSPGSLAHGMFQVVSGLAFLVLVAFGGLFVLHRVRRKTVFGQRGSLVDILETTPAGPGRQICLVRVHDRVVAVAFAASSVAPIAEFTGASAAEILADSGSGRTTAREFSATLDTFMERIRKPSAKEVAR